MARQQSVLVLLPFLFLLAACGGTRGVAEFAAYSDAYAAQQRQGDAVLDAFAAAERRLILRQTRTSGIIEPFDPDKAAYYVDGVDGPYTAGLRATLSALAGYNATLLGLANGETADALASRSAGILRDLGTAGSILAAGVGPVGALVEPATRVALTGPVGVARTIFGGLVAAEARNRFRAELAAAHPVMKDILAGLRGTTPAMFLVFERSRVDPKTSADTASGLAPDQETALEQDRRLLAGWVLLLDGTARAMDAAVAAAIVDGPAIRFTELADQATELRVLAETVRATRIR
ncbi:hypothetical protein P7L66_05020 (plasmid) [Tistrella mobilis]|uniref:hypothetical protein n=1 Tax=Tistrella mobilis TaxID=171437 RepID=UPI0035572C98